MENSFALGAGSRVSVEGEFGEPYGKGPIIMTFDRGVSGLLSIFKVIAPLPPDWGFYSGRMSTSSVATAESTCARANYPQETRIWMVALLGG